LHQRRRFHHAGLDSAGFSLQCSRGCDTDFGMRAVFHSVCFVLCAGIALNACEAPKKKFDLYEIAPSAAVGNDSYYTPPVTTRSSCMSSIAYSPSCGGI